MEELYKTDLNELDYDGSHRNPDIVECDKWALRSAAVNKASECDEILAELFKSPKEDPMKAVLRGKFIAIQSYLKKQENHRIDNVTYT